MFARPANMIGVGTTYYISSIGSFGVTTTLTTASAVFPSANRILYIPVRVPTAMVVSRFFVGNGATASGNFQIGLYTSNAGMPNRLIASTVSTAQSGTNTSQAVSITGVPISPGLYFLALTHSNTTGTFLRGNPALVYVRNLGIVIESPGVFGLPSTATPIAAVDDYVPEVGFNGVPMNEVFTAPMPANPIIHAGSSESTHFLNTSAITAFVSGTYAAANRAHFIPFRIYEPITITKLFVQNGTAVSGNVDVGIYSTTGNSPDRRILSTGSTAQAGISSIQEFDVTDTDLFPGAYYMAIAMDNVVGTILRKAATPVINVRSGMWIQNTAFPLPTTVGTLAVPTTTPLMGLLNKRTLI